MSLSRRAFFIAFVKSETCTCTGLFKWNKIFSKNNCTINFSTVRACNTGSFIHFLTIPTRNSTPRCDNNFFTTSFSMNFLKISMRRCTDTFQWNAIFSGTLFFSKSMIPTERKIWSTRVLRYIYSKSERTKFTRVTKVRYYIFGVGRYNFEYGDWFLFTRKENTFLTNEDTKSVSLVSRILENLLGQGRFLGYEIGRYWKI